MRGHLRKIHERPKKAYRAGNTNVIRRDFLHEKGPFYNLATSWHYVTSNWLAEMQIQLFARDWSRQRTPSSKASIGAWGTLVTWISNLIYMGLKFSTNFLLTSNFTYEVFWTPLKNQYRPPQLIPPPTFHWMFCILLSICFWSWLYNKIYVYCITE